MHKCGYLECYVSEAVGVMDVVLLMLWVVLSCGCSFLCCDCSMESNVAVVCVDFDFVDAVSVLYGG